MSATSSSTRGYRSELRRRQAAETRARIVDAAAELFGEHGYAGTTLARIAERAQVSVETVQKAGPKAALLRAAVGVRSWGHEGEVEFSQLDEGRVVLAVTDPAELAELLGETMTALNERVAGVWSALTGGAALDPELHGYYREMLASIRTQQERTLRVFEERGWLRRDVPFDELLAALSVVTSVEAYVRYVRLDGRPRDEYGRFIARTMRETVLAREA
jgi:AcrR family transcriptional regulator